MSDARLRELERQAMTGDRQAMARLLIEEARLGTAYPAMVCLARGTHRWAAVTAEVGAVGTTVAWSVCVDCWAADATKRERAPDAPCPDFVTIRSHVGMALVDVAGGRTPFGVRALCGYVVEADPGSAPLYWADLTTRASCGSCDRARPERVDVARKAAPEIHEALRALAADFVPNEAHTVSAPLEARSPVWGKDGTLLLARGGAMGHAYSLSHRLRVEGERGPSEADFEAAEWGEP